MITPGPTIKKYADLTGSKVEEVVAWMQGYVDGDWHDAQVPFLEDTKRGREASIKMYVKGRVDELL